MGKASHARQKRRANSNSESSSRVPEADSHPRVISESEAAALLRLLSENRGSKQSLASAYAWGYTIVHKAVEEGEYPEWYDSLDPLDLILLGIVYPKEFADSKEFGNARTAWLRELRKTPHWPSVGKFVSEAVDLSSELDLPVDNPQVLFDLNARIENAGLAHKRLPKAVHPGTLLASARFLRGLRTDMPLPPATSESLLQAERFAANLEPSFPQDGSCAELLRNGLFLLSRIIAPADTDSTFLLIALYISLTDSNDVPLDEIPERAHAWALGLPDESSLIIVIDAINACAAQDLPLITALSHLFVVPEFTHQVDREDRRWHSAPGTDFVPLAFELGGHDHVNTRSSRTYRLSPGGSAIVASVLRNKAPTGADTIEPPGHEDNVDDWVKMFDLIGLHPAWKKAWLDENAPLPRLDGTFRDRAGERDWHAAIERYIRAHPDEDPPDAEEELRKLRRYDGIMVMKQALADEAFAAELVDLVADDPLGEDYGLIGIRELAYDLGALTTDLLADEPEFEDQALTLAFKWGGPELRDRVAEYSETDAEDEVATLVLAGAYVQQASLKSPI